MPKLTCIENREAYAKKPLLPRYQSTAIQHLLWQEKLLQLLASRKIASCILSPPPPASSRAHQSCPACSSLETGSPQSILLVLSMSYCAGLDNKRLNNSLDSRPMDTEWQTLTWAHFFSTSPYQGASSQHKNLEGHAQTTSLCMIASNIA